jgi:hypothetical protein
MLSVPMTEKSSRLRYVEAAMRQWAEGGVEALVRFVGPDVEWHPHGADRPMRGREVLAWVRALEARGVTRSTGRPTFREFRGAVLVGVSLRDDSGSRGFVESQRTLVYEFADDELVRVWSFGSRSEAEAAVLDQSP